ncbi:cell wall hydrolase [Rhizobium mesoamericanum]|uniref:Cell wall hydrolase SleB n=1 Tax=Rhizobium mesoamericanum STM3625 TaxID=1211777 RepID=K0Q2A0_9HYPH|nr:cell wall hydrolase [Rhizobium mesoamericanum]CCM78575.1 Cell wall hydrolase SleB [Rhizobium mesoamericanum STM3625]
MRAHLSLGKSLAGILFAGMAAASCTTAQQPAPKVASQTTKPKNAAQAAQSTKVTFNYTAKDRDCLKRAMYFESEHSDRDGYMAVGTVVMNRLTSGAYPDTICGIVAQEKQFAPGVMTREVEPMAEIELTDAADAILRGERHPGVKDAMFFHTDGLKFPYRNMHYVAIAGGNAFYEKRGRDGELQTPAPLPSYEVAMNYLPGQSLMPAQFASLVPTTVPVPIPMPGPVATLGTEPAVMAPTDAAVPTTEAVIPVAIPTPRPAFNDAVLRGSLAHG